MEVKDFFNLYWKEKSLRWFDRYFDFLKIVNEDIFKKLSDFGGSRILAVGMGDTGDKEYFKKLKGEIISIDISWEGFKGLDRFRRIQMDANKMGFKKASFDVVFFRTVMLHLNHRRVLSEIKRVLKKEGRFFWIEPMKNNFFLWIYRFIISPGRFTKIDYLTYKEVLFMETFFRNSWHKEYFLLTVLLIPFYIFFPKIGRFIVILQKIEMKIVDRCRWLKRFCWITYGYGERG